MDRKVDKTGDEKYQILTFADLKVSGIPALISILDNKDHLEVRFSDGDENLFVLRFVDVFLFRKCQERFMLSSVGEISRHGLIGNLAVKISSSKLLDWLREEALFTVDDLETTHIRLLFSEDIVDIVVPSMASVRVSVL